MAAKAEARGRTCRRCSSDSWHRNGGPRKNGYQPWACAPCKITNVKAWQERNPERRRELARKGTRNFNLRQKGITASDFDRLRAEQGGACAICRERFSRTPHIDHCHALGGVRGLLCGSCNRAIGLFKDQPERLEAAAAYLRRHLEKQLTLVEVS